MTGAAVREHVVAVAREWMRTPFHDCANLKGIGVDCANFLAKVYEEAGVIEPLKIEPYSPQWFLHHRDEKFIGYVLTAGGREIDEADARMGDAVLYRLGKGRCFAHGGIIAAWPDEIIHAYKPAGMVTVSQGLEGELGSGERRFFSMWR